MQERRSRNRYVRVIKIRLHRLMWRTDLLSVRSILALSAVLYGIFMLCNPTSLLISNMLSLMPSHIWGMLFLLQGFVMLWSLVCDKRPKITLWVDAVLGVALWTSSTIACLLYLFPASTPISTLLEYYELPPNMIANVGLTFASWWVLIRHYTDGDIDGIT